MIRSQVLLSEEISKEIKKLSRTQGISQSKVVRQLLSQSLDILGNPESKFKRSSLEQPRGNMAMDRVNFHESDIPYLIKMWDEKARILGWESFKFGYSNKIYKVNLEKTSTPIVLKIAVVPQRYDKLVAEIKLLSLINKNIPVPKILFSLTDRLKYKYPFVIYSYIKGDNWMEVIDELPEPDLKKISGNLGELVAQLHAIKYPKVIDFGKERSFESWIDFITEITDNGLFKMRENNLRIDLVKKIEDFYFGIKHKLTEPTTYSLIHRDLQAMNILVAKGKIVGLLDFESAMTGDFLYEFAFLEGLLFDRYPETKKSFYEGYKRKGELPENYQETIDFYILATKLYYIQRAIDYKEPDRFKENFDFLERFFRKRDHTRS